MGIDPVYFLDDMSLEAFELAYEGWDTAQKDNWEQTRLIAFYTARPYLKGNPTIEKFMPLKWDKKKKSKAPKSTKDKFNKLKGKLDKYVNDGR